MGESALAVIRVSGPAALDVVTPLIRSRKPLDQWRSHRLARVTLVDPRSGTVLDEALCTVMRAPRSYTGEDTVEISCHGSPALARMLIDRLVTQGARLAEPGEFTRRAFVSGRLDLAQAEAVALLISARTERAVTLAARGIGGDLSRRIEAVRDGLVDVIANLEVVLDFPDDADDPDTAQTVNTIRYLGDAIDGLVTAARRGLVAHTGLTVAIVGAPNAGKSSLFNALLGRDRAIVTPQAGTTRDVLEGTIAVSGVPIQLLDTAGIGTPRDPIDAEGMRRAEQAIEQSDLLILVVDGSGPEEALRLDTCGKPHLVVLAKSDLEPHPHAASRAGAVPASVRTDGGLDVLLGRLSAEVEQRSGGDLDGSAIGASMRQVGLLQALAGSIHGAAAALRTHPTEIALIELRGALEAASAILGVEIGDAVLDAIFSRFCVGK
jgi:tRNA modification GTPase